MPAQGDKEKDQVAVCKNRTEPDLGLLLSVRDGLCEFLDELCVEGVDGRLVHADGGDALVVGGHGDVRGEGGGGGEPSGGLHTNNRDDHFRWFKPGISPRVDVWTVPQPSSLTLW